MIKTSDICILVSVGVAFVTATVDTISVVIDPEVLQ